ncbi:MAG: hypothetical protein QOJ81_2054 [Chloroflexota bacterium]|jgi:hypothetical protein|nr:hypothetical protein [Chloroflexota bacterium]
MAGRSYQPVIRSSTDHALASDLHRFLKEIDLARAKNTERAEARKRSRDAHRNEMAALDEDEQFDDESVDEAPAARPSIFQIPDILADARALPSIFRSRPLVWLPFGLVLIGFVLALVIYGMPTEFQQWVALYLQFFFVPQGLFTYFIAGFLAPRASYLVGMLLGALSGALYGIAIVATLPAGTSVPLSDAALNVGSYAVTGIVLGTFAGGFAAWYRNFLRNMQTNGSKRRADKEGQERAKRRQQRQESRSVFKQRTP